MIDRSAAIAAVASRLDPSWLVVACNGMIGRELYTHADAARQFYMIGSMGLASSIGLGLALAQPSRTVVIFDGDGNVLMNLGTLGSIAAAGVSNLYHVVFDNHAHGSTGGQKTISDRVSLDAIARAAGYRQALRAMSFEALASGADVLFREPGPGMLLVEVTADSQPGIRRVEPTPDELTARFRSALLAGRLA